MDLLLIRHGESEADILNVFEGRANYDLTSLGHQQADALARWIHNKYTITAIVSSPLERAKQTAQYISLATGIDIEYNSDLMEWDNGKYAGVPKSEVAKKYPPKVCYPHSKNYEQESVIEFRARVETVVSKIVNTYAQNSIIAIITHGGTINVIFRSLLGLPVYSKFEVLTGDTCVHYLRIKDDTIQLLFSNSKEHLANEQ